MAKNIKKQLENFRTEFGIYKTIKASEENKQIYDKMIKENQRLPDGVRMNTLSNGFLEVQKEDISMEEENLYIQYSQLRYQKKIYEKVSFVWLVFFIAFIIGCAILLISFLSLIGLIDGINRVIF